MTNVFVFPGQGAHVNKVSTLYSYDAQLYSEEVKTISEAYGMDILDFACKADAKTLSQVRYTQLVMFATSICFYEVLKKNNVHADMVAGHSIGQFSAMYAAGCFDLFEEAKLVKRRADLMGKISTSGRLCAVKAPFSIDISLIKTVCDEISNSTDMIIDIALINSDKQVVVGGEEIALSYFCKKIKDLGVGYSPVVLPVGQAFHTKLMEPMIEPFSDYLGTLKIKKPNISIVLNTTGSEYTGGDLRQELLDHCVKPVLWYDSMLRILQEENIQVFEVGLGHTLAGFFRNISKEKVILLEDAKSFNNALATLRGNT